jgi:hypothetical protein
MLVQSNLSNQIHDISEAVFLYNNISILHYVHQGIYYQIFVLVVSTLIELFYLSIYVV